MSNNIVQNGGFETGDFTDWAVSDAPAASQGYADIGVDSYPGDVNSGSFGVFAGNDVTTSLAQNIATVAGHEYTVSFDLNVYQSNAIEGGVSATFGGQTVTNLVEPGETDAFTPYTATIEATSNTSQLQFSFLDPGGFFGFDDVSVTDNGPCYCRGTRILTERGELPIETLEIGDRVMMHEGGARPIRWIGRRSYSRSHANGNRAVLPIRITSGALGDGLPRRNLWVSPEHAMYIDGMLIAARDLVNDRSIAQAMTAEALTYFHLEFDAHAVIFAEGAPSESFVDDESRKMFDNAAEFHRLYPDAGRSAARYCAPRVQDGWELEAVRQRLAERCAEMNESSMPGDVSIEFRHSVQGAESRV